MTIATKYQKEDLLLYKDTGDISLKELQLQELDSGIKEADAGVFASDDEIEKVLTKWL